MEGSDGGVDGGGDGFLISVSSLLCHEDDDCLQVERSISPSPNGLSERLSLGAEIDEEYVEMLLGKEIGGVGFKGLGIGCDPFEDGDGKASNWVKVARLDAVKWILNVKVRELLGFQFSTAFIAMTYFDQFISRQSVDDGLYWAIRLLSVACFSVAVKMEECNIPVLADYPLGDYNFQKSVIQRTELLVLSTLEWQMASVTPFAYLDYFIDKFCAGCESKPHDQLVVKATEFVMELLQEINAMSRRPSSIAAAATLAALDIQLSRNALEIKLGLIPSSRSLKNEEVFSCYCLMQEMKNRKCKTPELEALPNLPHMRSTDVDEKSTRVASNAGTKRRLSYCETENHGSPSKKMDQ